MNINLKEKLKQNKHLKLLKAHDNNIKISDKNLSDKYTNFEDSKLNESETLLYEINTNPTHYKRYSRGQIVRVKFGVNIGSEFSGDHYAIIISKQDTMFNPVIHVVPLTSKKHEYNLDVGNVIYSEDELAKLRLKYDSLSSTKRKKEIKKIIQYYSKRQDNISYACIKHLKTISKLSVCKPLNRYDYVNKLKVGKNIMDEIDEAILKEYTLIELNSKMK